MRLLEYEAKYLLKQFGAVVPTGSIVQRDVSTTVRADFPLVVKSQVPVGGRGKAGGVVVVDSIEELQAATEKIFGLQIKGYTPHTLLLEPKLSIAHEYYLSLLINRETSSIQLVAHAQGGIEVESQTGFSSWDLEVGENDFASIGQQLAKLYDSPGDASQLEAIAGKLYECFVSNDATLLEINPLIKMTDGVYVCADAKMELDDAASFRHKDWGFENKPGDANFVTLDREGDVATIANGAGLAMATVDAVASYGMRPANFLDVGGGANKESVLRAFTRIMEYRSVKAIVINIFAGITRCDEVARAIIAAKSEIDTLPPLFIRLAGTNFEEAAQLLKEENIPTLATLEACLRAAKKEIKSS